MTPRAAAGPLGRVVGDDRAAASRSFKVANPRLRSKLVCCLPREVLPCIYFGRCCLSVLVMLRSKAERDPQLKLFFLSIACVQPYRHMFRFT